MQSNRLRCPGATTHQRCAVNQQLLQFTSKQHARALRPMISSVTSSTSTSSGSSGALTQPRVLTRSGSASTLAVSRSQSGVTCVGHRAVCKKTKDLILCCCEPLPVRSDLRKRSLLSGKCQQRWSVKKKGLAAMLCEPLPVWGDTGPQRPLWSVARGQQNMRQQTPKEQQLRLQITHSTNIAAHPLPVLHPHEEGGAPCSNLQLL